MWKKPLLFLIAQIVVIILGVTLSYFVSGKNSLKSIQTINAPNSENIKGETYVATDESDFLSQNQTYEVLVTRVIDGDTIEIEGSQRIRYIGIDSPETVNPNIKTQCFGTAAAGKNKELVEGKIVEIEKDVRDVEKWMIERRKFLIKLGWVLGFITILLIVSHFYLRVRGAGV